MKRDSNKGPMQFGVSSLIVGTTLFAVGVSLGVLTLLVGGGILASVFFLASMLLLQYLLWGWWLGPALRNSIQEEVRANASPSMKQEDR